MSNIQTFHDVDLQHELNRRREMIIRRQFNGANWTTYLELQVLQKNLYRGLRNLPNLEEIDSYEFAQIIHEQHSAVLWGHASVERMDGIRFARYATVMCSEVGPYVGKGYAFVAVPEDPAEWEKSQHYSSEVKHKLRHWKFCYCKHDFKQVAYRNCVTKYACSECDYTYEVDSS